MRPGDGQIRNSQLRLHHVSVHTRQNLISGGSDGLDRADRQNSWRVRYPHDDGTYGSQSSFHTKKAAEDYAHDLDTDRRRGTWLDPAGAKRPLADWAAVWIETLDVEQRTEENYRGYLRNHILPRWGTIALGDITSLAVTEWWKDLRRRYAASTIAGIRTVLSMMLDDAVDERLIPTNPIHRHRRRGRRRDHAPTTAERVWAMPEHIIRIAEQATTRGGPSAGLLIITAAWTGCRWGELAGLHATTSTSTSACSPSIPTPEPCMNPPATSGSAHRKHPPPRAPSPCRHSSSPCSATTSKSHPARSCSPAPWAVTCAAAPSTAGSSDPPSTAILDTA
jgi:integrase-like protein